MKNESWQSKPLEPEVHTQVNDVKHIYHIIQTLKLIITQYLTQITNITDQTPLEIQTYWVNCDRFTVGRKILYFLTMRIRF